MSLNFLWLMLLPQWLMELPLIGWCNWHIAVGTPIKTAYVKLVVIVADGITTFWLMLLPVYCGRWNYHLLADVIANMADGIYVHQGQ